MALSQQIINEFCKNLAAKQPAPGGGASAAMVAAIGTATAAMLAAYTQRKKDQESGAAEHARTTPSPHQSWKRGSIKFRMDRCSVSI